MPYHRVDESGRVEIWTTRVRKGGLAYLTTLRAIGLHDTANMSRIKHDDREGSTITPDENINNRLQ